MRATDRGNDGGTDMIELGWTVAVGLPLVVLISVILWPSGRP
ncbi:hypothetical protein [Nocardia jiangsuensis]|uniref:Uncharacterized protein n=1 Tax=Nocardia jiangsuensis TaxID=1691563 RepID=A0ABV8DXP6_9NOCA